MRLTPLIVVKLNELTKINPSLTFGEILYSILHRKNLKRKEETVLNWLLDINENDFYTAVERFSKSEQEDVGGVKPLSESEIKKILKINE